MEQRTDEWHEARLGKVTASAISNVMMKETTKGYQDYRAQLVTERLTGEPTPSFRSDAMQWGIDHEHEARLRYQQETFQEVREEGFVDHPEIYMSGASPDGLVVNGSMVTNFGLVEIKCPNSATHINTLISEAPAKRYIQQMQWQMACTCANWCDFVSYDPRMPESLQIFITRIERDYDAIQAMEKAVSDFLQQVADLESKLTHKMEIAAE